MAFTEFYCDAATGSNLNAGTGGTNDYTTAAGNWTNATRIFTVTDGTNPSTKIAVNDFCSVYVTAGATVATFIGRVSAVQNATNGTVTFATAFMGANPSNGTGTMTLKHGGFWQGPNAASGFPFDRAGIPTAVNANNDRPRINLKNTSTYSITAQITVSASAAGSGYTIRGYSSSAGDSGRATIDGGTNAIILLSSSVAVNLVLENLIFSNNGTTGSNNLLSLATNNQVINCVFHGSRGSCVVSNASYAEIRESEFYDFNTSNTANKGAIEIGASGAVLNVLRCYIHDASAGNANGIMLTAGGNQIPRIYHTVFDTLGGTGILHNTVNVPSGIWVYNSDFYGLTNGIKFTGAVPGAWLYVENSNFSKCSTFAIDGGSATRIDGFLYYNGYGSGTEANGGNYNTTTGLELDDSTGNNSRVVYASGNSPYNSPTTGDFKIALAAARNVGRGIFTQTDGTNTGTVGYQDIGAAQHRDTQKASTFGG